MTIKNELLNEEIEKLRAQIAPVRDRRRALQIEREKVDEEYEAISRLLFRLCDLRDAYEAMGVKAP